MKAFRLPPASSVAPPASPVVESERGDVLDIVARNVGVEVLEVANCQYHAPFRRQEFEALVVGEPATNTHAFAECVVFHI